MAEENKSVWKELCDAIQYCIDSMKGKYSLESYLDIIGEYADRLILSEEENGNEFLEGRCTLKKSEDDEYYDFEVDIYFKEPSGQMVEKEASREIAKEKFTKETEGIVGDQVLQYRIDKPERSDE